MMMNKVQKRRNQIEYIPFTKIDELEVEGEEEDASLSPSSGNAPATQLMVRRLLLDVWHNEAKGYLRVLALGIVSSLRF